MYYKKVLKNQRPPDVGLTVVLVQVVLVVLVRGPLKGVWLQSSQDSLMETRAHHVSWILTQTAAAVSKAENRRSCSLI